jgi:glycerol uptake facilitator-like aquaporin
LIKEILGAGEWYFYFWLPLAAPLLGSIVEKSMRLHNGGGDSFVLP